MNMIFTVGDEFLYEKYFRDQAQPQKKGRTENYRGGSVWLTREDAEHFAPFGYKVYGVIADWATETVPSKDGMCHDLLVDADLVRLD